MIRGIIIIAAIILAFTAGSNEMTALCIAIALVAAFSLFGSGDAENLKYEHKKKERRKQNKR